ncbi:hypothetical protein [Burkholderia stagnalis]|uniref:hypothetical protein n=1 Tax=Burkholderia stagnalis TaxID=1503054 RepID=UPI0013DF5BBE|nr:hypothetical protein [Burkholderia stagnalis]
MLVGSTLTSLETLKQLNRLISFGYMSLVDSMEVGGHRYGGRRPMAVQSRRRAAGLG